MVRWYEKVLGGVCAALMVASAAPSWSAEILVPAAPLIQQNEMQALQNRLQRQQYQQNQQLLRELDRQAVPPQPRRQNVPIMKPTCQLPVYGESGSVSGCR